MAALRERLGESATVLRSAMANRSIRRLQFAFAGSAVGQWACSTAVTVFSFQAGGAAAVTLQLLLRMVPAAIAAPFLSTLADRYPRVRVMVLSDSIRVVILLVMAALAATGAPFVLVLIASGLSGIAATAFEPAKAALLPSLAERPEELTAANVVSSSIDSVSFFAGPAIGGLLLAATSTQVVLVVTAAAFAWSALLVSRIPEARVERERAEAEPGVFSQVGEGLRAVRSEPRIQLLLGFFGAQIFVDGALAVLLVATAIDELGLGAAGVGLLSSTVGIGGILGVAASATLAGRARLGPAFALGMALWGLPLLALGLVPATGVAVVALATTGLANTLGDVSGTTLLQRVTPEAVTGRVFGLLDTMLLSSFALGSVAGGLLLTVAGVQVALLAVGAVLPVLLIVFAGAVRGLDSAGSPADVSLLRRVDLFAPLGTVDLERLAEALEPVRAAAGDVLIRQGEPGERLLLIVSGAVAVTVDGLPVRTQGPGEYFGEIALLRDSPRTATVTATEDTELRALGREIFLSVVAGHASTAAAAEAVVGGRLATARPLAVAG